MKAGELVTQRQYAIRDLQALGRDAWSAALQWCRKHSDARQQKFLGTCQFVRTANATLYVQAPGPLPENLEVLLRTWTKGPGELVGVESIRWEIRGGKMNQVKEHDTEGARLTGIVAERSISELGRAFDARLPGLGENPGTNAETCRSAAIVARAAQDLQRAVIASGGQITLTAAVHAVMLVGSSEEMNPSEIARVARIYQAKEADSGRTVSTAQAVAHVMEQAP
jgi:hypothetical protein